MNIISKFFQHNWIASIYLNFKMLPFKQAIKLPLDVYHGVKLFGMGGKIIINSDNIYRGMIKIGSQGSDMFPRLGCILSIEGTIIFQGTCVFGCSNSIKVLKDATLKIGEGSTFGAYNLIFASSSINIGRNFLSSWYCQFMDSDTHTIIDLYSMKTSKMTKPINIGNHCWVGNNVSINKGSVIPDDCIIASNSLVNKDLSNVGMNNLIAGSPAKVVRNNIKWII